MTALIVTMALVSVVPSFAGMNRWTGSGPAGASITALIVDPVDSRIVYAATSGAGIFRSISTGEPSWKAMNVGLTEAVITAIAIDATDPAVIFASTRTGAVLRSGDRGESWTVAMKSTGEYVSAIAIDGKRHTIYVATNAGVLMSDLNEGTWRAVPELQGGFVSVTVAADGAVYAASWERLYTSKDGGTTWTGGFTLPGLRTVVSDAENGTVYAANWISVWASSDGARTWRPLPTVQAQMTSLLAVRGGLYAATDRGAYLYDSTTSQWARVGSFTRPVTTLAFAESTPPRAYAGTAVGVLTAFAPDSEWRPANDGMNAAFMLDLAVAHDDVAYATTNDGLFQSLDGAATWRKVSGLDEPLPHSGASSGCCVVAPIATSGSKTVYVAGEKGVYRSTDQALTWQTVTPRVATALAVSSDAATLYAAFSDGMSKSTDGGDTWRLASIGLFDSPYGTYSWQYIGASDLETDVDDPAVVHVTYGEGAFRSSSRGESWKRVFGQMSPNNVLIQAIATRGPVSHVSVWSHGITTTVDDGATWSPERLTDEHILALIIDPQDSSRSYAGTANGRVYRSDDFGQQWILFGDVLSGAPAVQHLAINDSGDRIYAATSGGVFVYQIGDAPGADRLPDDALRLPSLMRQLVTADTGTAATLSTVAFILPAVGTVRGFQGIVFRADVTLSNGRSSEQDVVLAWLPQGNVSGSVVPMFHIKLAASTGDSGATLTINDVAGELGLSGLGSIAVFAVDGQGQLDEDADIDGSARVRTPASCGSGSVSQSVSGIASFGAHRKARALGLRHESAYRTNVGIVNMGELPREFTIVVAGDRHSERLTVSVPPFSLMHAAVPDGNYGALSITVITDQGAAPWAAYGSTVDNASADSWTSIATPRPDR